MRAVGYRRTAMYLLAGLVNCVTGVHADHDASGSANTELDGIVATAIANNPDIAMAGARVEAARAAVPQSSALPDR